MNSAYRAGQTTLLAQLGLNNMVKFARFENHSLLQTLKGVGLGVGAGAPMGAAAGWAGGDDYKDVLLGGLGGGLAGGAYGGLRGRRAGLAQTKELQDAFKKLKGGSGEIEPQRVKQVMDELAAEMGIGAGPAEAVLGGLGGITAVSGSRALGARKDKHDTLDKLKSLG